MLRQKWAAHAPLAPHALAIELGADAPLALHALAIDPGADALALHALAINLGADALSRCTRSLLILGLMPSRAARARY
jgi:hypothetical protein